jgi:hypothetical protein
MSRMEALLARGDADGAEAAYRAVLRVGLQPSASRLAELLLLLAVQGGPRSLQAVVEDLRKQQLKPSPVEMVARIVSAR